jgi:hypothetical protein
MILAHKDSAAYFVVAEAATDCSVKLSEYWLSYNRIERHIHCIRGMQQVNQNLTGDMLTILVVDRLYIKAALYLVVRNLTLTYLLKICKKTVHLYTIFVQVLLLKENYYIINYLSKVNKKRWVKDFNTIVKAKKDYNTILP